MEISCCKMFGVERREMAERNLRHGGEETLKYACLCLLFSHLQSFVHFLFLSVADSCLKERLIESLHGSTGNSFKWSIVFSFSPSFFQTLFAKRRREEEDGKKESSFLPSSPGKEEDFNVLSYIELVLWNPPFFVFFSIHVFSFVLFIEK